jgi:hypothetical protein
LPEEAVVRDFRILLFGSVLALTTITGSRALAASDKPPPAAQEAFAEGKRLYEAGDKKNAAEKFKEAYRLSKNALLLYNIGFVHDELGDATIAIHYYRMFLEKAEANTKSETNRKLAAERIKALEAVENAAAAEPAPALKPAEKAATRSARTASRATKLEHQAVEVATAGKSLRVVADAPSSWKVILHWRRAGDESFQDVALEEDPQGRLVAHIPARKVSGNALHYYIEATDGAGKVVATAGSAGSPNLVEVQGGEAALPESPTEAPVATGDSGWTTKRKLKWGFTGGAALLLGGAVVSYVTWGNYRSALRDELELRCGPDLCPPMTDYERELRDGRDRWRMINWVTLGTGVVTAGIAGYFWYADREPARPKSVSAAPVIAPGYVGAAAALTF